MRFNTGSSAVLAMALTCITPVSGYIYRVTVKGCVWNNDPPDRSYTVNWSTARLKQECMHFDMIPNARMTVSAAGLTCTDIGTVVDDSMDIPWCKDDAKAGTGQWLISYMAPSVPYSGSTMFDWYHWGFYEAPSNVTLKDFTQGTSVCLTNALCPSTQINWSWFDIRTIRVIFRAGVGHLSEEELKNITATAEIAEIAETAEAA